MEKLKTLLILRRLQVAVAESLTCGQVQAALGSISGSSAYFAGGITAYNLAQKTRLLGIDAAHAERVNSVSQQIAFELAAGVCRLFNADIGLGTTGYAEPDADHQIIEPMAYVAICRRKGDDILPVAGEQIIGKNLNRLEMQTHVADSLLKLLLSQLEAESSLFFA